MALYKYINRIERLDGMIRRKSTGPPAELAEKLDISERWLYKFLEELRMDLNCPIKYDPYHRSYIYEEPGALLIGFQKKLSRDEKRRISGGRNIFEKNFATVSICSVRGYTLQLKSLKVASIKL